MYVTLKIQVRTLTSYFSTPMHVSNSRTMLVTCLKPLKYVTLVEFSYPVYVFWFKRGYFYISNIVPNYSQIRINWYCIACVIPTKHVFLSFYDDGFYYSCTIVVTKGLLYSVEELGYMSIPGVPTEVTLKVHLLTITIKISWVFGQ